METASHAGSGHKTNTEHQYKYLPQDCRNKFPASKRATVEPLYCGHRGDLVKYSVLYREVSSLQVKSRKHIWN